MIKVDNKEKYINLFSQYTHNIPVIYSCLEGQYNGELYVDSENNPQIAILFTQFAFHFVAGNADINNLVEIIDEIIFKEYILKSGLKEAIVFSCNEKWDKVLDEVFKKHNGLKDSRKIFYLNRDKYKKMKTTRKIPKNIENKIFYEKSEGAKKQYPISRVFLDEKCISFCSGFMLGKGHAEIDIATEEAYRGRGYAKQAAITLIDELLQNEIEPDWCTWPYRIESQKLALSLGFELRDQIPAHIWVEAECGKLLT